MTNEELRRACETLVALPKRDRGGHAEMRMFNRFVDLAGPAEVLALIAERDRAVASVAALLHAYIGITPGTTVDGLAPEVQAEAERLLEERLALEAERDELRDRLRAMGVADA